MKTKIHSTATRFLKSGLALLTATAISLSAINHRDVLAAYLINTLQSTESPTSLEDDLAGHWTFDGPDITGSTTSGSTTNTGWLTASTGANMTGVGTSAWSNPTNGTTSNNSYATVAGSGTSGWFNENYTKRKKLTIDETKVGGSSNLTNYPVLVSMTDTDLRTTANGGDVTSASGYDIIFTDGTNSTQLDHEIESYNASTGEINMWVSIPTLSVSADTDFYIYYGNSGISTSQEDAASVWSAYEAVWHLNSDLEDSANSHDGTDYNTTSSTGIVGNGRLCDHSPTTRYFSVPDDGSTLDHGTNFTASIWVRPTEAFINWDKIMTKGVEGTADMSYVINVATAVNDEPSVNFYNTAGGNGNARSTVSMNPNGSTWYHIASVKTGTDVSVFTNGSETESYSQAFSGTPRDGDGDLYVCANVNGWGSRFQGDVDEVRIAKTNLSAGWIATEHSTITNKGTGTGKFIKTVASEESPTAGSVTSNYLRASNFGFNIPTTATINGIEVRFERKTDATSNTNIVKLVNASGTVAGNDKSTDPSWSGSDTFETYGGTSDLWGLTLAPTDINDIDFGFVVSATHQGSAAQYASIDSMQVRVSYTTAGASNLSALDVSGNGNNGDVISSSGGGTPQTIFLTTGTSWTVPADWNSGNNTIEVIGGGGGGATGTTGGSSTGARGGAGGGGGGYAKITNATLTQGNNVTVAIGTGGGIATAGGDTYLCNSTSNCATIGGTAVIVGAKGGGGASGQTAGSGGLASGSVGATKVNGGDGNTSGSPYTSKGSGGGGGGGAGGPNAAGNNGNASADATIGSSSTGGSGGQGDGTAGGTGGGGGAGISVGAGSPGNGGNNGTEWQSSPAYGSGGGGGGGGGGGAGGVGGAGANGGTYGAGGSGGGGGGSTTKAGGSGGSGTGGLIVINYTPSASGTVEAVPGALGQALDFNGTSDYVDIGATAQTVNSVSFWLKADDTTTRNILGLNGTANINLNSSSVVTATGFTSPTIYVDGVVASTIPDNDWHHVVVTTGTGISTSDMDIGRFSTGYFDGSIDDVRIYSRALTANEIARLYAMGESKTNASSVDRYTDGLIGHWTMDGNNIDWSNSTAEIQDSSIEGNDGNAYSMTAADAVQPGILGQALQFDGTDDLIDIPNTSDLKPSNDISISFWTKLDQTASALGHNQVLLYKGHSSAPWYSYIVQQFSANDKLAFQWVNSSGTDYYAETNTTLSAGIWYHIVAVKRNGQTHQIYINGVDETGWSATSSGTIFNSSNGLTFGSNWGNDDVDGMMDDVRIYNRALTADEVTGLYAMGEVNINNSMTDRVADDLVGHWTMDGADVSGTSQSGTATDTGYITAGTGANNTAVGTAAWTNPTNGTTSNNSYATVAGSGTAGWFDANYGKRKKLTIDETKVGGASNLTNYPILVSMTDTDLRTTANGGDVTNASGYDIIFTDGTNSTQLAHEIESYNASTGAINMWVSIPTLSVSADTDFYIYYGNSGVSTSQENAATVWDAYEAVWHLNDAFTDSANSHDGTNTGSVDDVGVVGRGRDFSDDYITVPDGGNNSLDVSTNMTVSTWIKPDTAYSNYAKFLTKGADGSNIGWSMDVNTGSSNRVQANFYNTTPTYNNVVSNTTMSTAGNTWYHVTGVKTGADLSFFVNGVENENWSGGFSGTPRDVSGNLYIGASAGGGANRVSGDMDEVRIAKTNLSAGWLLTEYNTITLKGTGAGKFIKTVASEESSGSGSVTTNYLRASNFGFNIPSTATIDGIEVGFERKTGGSSTTTSSVRLVDATGTIAGNDKSTGAGWTASDVWENHGGSSDLWGLTLTPTDINDTDFGFVVSAAHTGTSAQNASIDSLRVKVYYTTAGTNDLSAVDRTANTNDGDITGATPDFGTLGQAMDFDGSDDLISIPDNATLDFGASENFSVSTWVKTTQAVVADTWPIIVNKESGSSPRQGYGLTLHDSNWNANWYFEIWVGGTKYQCFGDNNIADGEWHHLVGIRNGSNLEVYEDGALADTCAGSTSSVANSRPFNFGGISGGSWSFFDGNIDDIRLYNRALTADEVYDLYQVGAP